MILVILTTIAVQATGNLADQARFDATQRTLQNIQNAIVGPAGQREPDGTPLITGFVADIGRLPVATVDATGALTLNELWSNPNSLPTFTSFATSDSYVTVYAGWRGPYLQLPPGSTQLTDGWGNPLSITATNPAALFLSNGTAISSAGQSIQIVTSGGENFGTPGTGYASPTSVFLRSNRARRPEVDLVTRHGYGKYLSRKPQHQLQEFRQPILPRLCR